MELRRYLPNYVLEFLRSVVLSDRVSDWDSIVWSKIPSGIYSVKSVYEVLTNQYRDSNQLI